MASNTVTTHGGKLINVAPSPYSSLLWLDLIHELRLGEMNLLKRNANGCLRTIVNNPFKKSFYEKKKKINVLTVFFIFYKSGFKTLLK